MLLTFEVKLNPKADTFVGVILIWTTRHSDRFSSTLLTNSHLFGVSAIFTSTFGMVLFTILLGATPKGFHNPLTIWVGAENIFLLQVWLQA